MSTPLTLGLVLSVVVALWTLRGHGEGLSRARFITGCGPGGATAASVAARWVPAPRPVPARLAGLTRVRRALRTWLSPGRTRLGPEFLCVPVAVIAALLLDSPVPLVAGIVAVPVLRRRLRRLSVEREAARRRAGVITLCGELAADLRAGRAPCAALTEAVGGAHWMADGADTRGLTGGVLAAARFGGDVPDALRRAAQAPGAAGLAGVAACWQVGMDSGAALAGGLDRVAASLRADDDQQEELRAQLAGPRSTAVVLAMLPLFGLLLGTAMGAEPLDVLLHTPVGLGCLVLGVALQCAGLAWTTRIVRSAR